MKTMNFKIIKINRLWIEALTGSYKCKIKVSENTKELKDGLEVELLVEDISIRSKYGTDLRFDAKPQSKEHVFLKAKYNKILVEECRNLGGQWDAEEKVWVFDAIVADKVAALEEIYCSEMIDIEITALDDIFVYVDKVCIAGYPICAATGRDGGAKLCEGVSKISGDITSGGSAKNWTTVVKQDSVFRLSISKNMLEKVLEDSDFDVKVL